ncbi:MULTISPECIES: response regulator [unclassified Duganella]|uniref:response regulator transcription factor n=1 Tax=unclassified Duganella TaxID=2636909 RepID=UPI000E342027|nr:MULTISPECIES: response regulator [unclassified Duganella]RFP10063.1 DNA-binding response regulator [Duganella sp. BJB475]RFP25632.1 DNA-binding response regulator [Duganella sp. BJB476]
MTASDTQPSILIVDDSAFEQRMLVDLLSELPYKVSVAVNGLQGYQLALAQHPDLILLDVRMPNMDGYTACRLLKANPVTEDIPIIFLSGADADEERIMGLSIGGVDFVTKPFSPGELAARIQVHLKLARRASRPSAAAAPSETQETHEADPDAVIVNAAKRLIADNLASLPGLAEIARSVGTYREKLSHVFREQTGMTVFAFIRETRIRRGEELLKDTDIDVQDIALMIGFNNAGNFATAFRERLGVTPSAFRQSIQHKKTPHG